MFISSQPNLQSCRACCTRQQKVYQDCLHVAGNIRGTHCQPTTLYSGESWSFSESFLFSCYLIIHASLLVCRAPLWLSFADQTRPRAHPTTAGWKKCISGDVTMSPWAQNRLSGKFSPTDMRWHPQQYVKSILQKKKNIPFFAQMFCIWLFHDYLIPLVNITRPELSVTTVSDSLLVEWKIRSCLSEYLYHCQLKYRVC